MYMKKNINNNNIDKKCLLNAGPNSKIMKDYKNSLYSLTDIQAPRVSEASIGLLLGDASLQTQNNGKTFRLKFEWGEKNKPYLDHVYALFNEWVISPPHQKIRININNNQVINWAAYALQTISHEAFICVMTFITFLLIFHLLIWSNFSSAHGALMI